MDDIVRQALAKWPNVPHCYGWLGLDARGNWYLRDDSVQAQGAFGGGPPQAKGSLLQHAKLIDFIGRNYESDARGQWFFQNGPQRVYVELETTPWVLRVAADYSVSTHTGAIAQAQRCLVDDAGKVYLDVDLGLGLVHSQDMLGASEAIESGLWVPLACTEHELPRRFAFVKSPQALNGAPKI
ncbi:MAG: DUF2946 family protein [Burkholderiaceae bacterium]